MKTPLCWEKTIPVRWFRLAAGGLLASFLALRAQPAPATARLAEAVKAARQQRYEQASKELRTVRPHLPQLSDYIAYWLGWVEFQSGNYAAALKELEAVWKAPIPSPLAGKAAVLAARAHLAAGTPTEAVRLLASRSQDLPQPEAENLLAACWEAAGDLPAAAASYQRVYYRYPASPEAAAAEKELARLRAALGERYPPPLAQEMLGRADIWLGLRRYGRARAEYEALSRQLGGRERELARVRVGVALYWDYDTPAAYGYLRSFEATDAAADAERLYYLAECARRLGRDEEMLELVERLGKFHPKATWRLRALISAGNRFLLENQADKFVPLYRACGESFSEQEDASYCHWKLAWWSYLGRRADAEELLREHLLRYPASQKAAAALYFLGRLAEKRGDASAAKAWYEALRTRFPNHYHGGQAGRRLERKELAQASTSAQTAAFLRQIAWPKPAVADGFQANAATRLRLERARLLGAAGLDDMQEEELRFGARTDGQPHLAALELARAMSRTGPVHRMIRTMKELAPDYLAVRQEGAPKQFWLFLFPLPHRRLIEAEARRNRLDPFLIAGLVRQESEFNPGAVSPARAYGLAQILPSQGRILARQVGLKGYRTGMLFQPAVSLRLGTFFLRSLLDRFDGRLEVALAAYNAGPNRAERWLGWGRFEEPAEFIETIPLTETRNYVTAVLRNAEIYRWLYASAERPATAAKPGEPRAKPQAPAPSSPAKKASAALSPKQAPAAAAQKKAPTAAAGPPARRP